MSVSADLEPRLNLPARVRFRTRRARACAKPDIESVNSACTCPLPHTASLRVCKSGQTDVSIPWASMRQLSTSTTSQRMSKQTAQIPAACGGSEDAVAGLRLARPSTSLVPMRMTRAYPQRLVFLCPLTSKGAFGFGFLGSKITGPYSRAFYLRILRVLYRPYGKTCLRFQTRRPFSK